MRTTRRLLLVAAAALLAVPATATAAEPDILFSASPKNVTIQKSGKTLRLSMPAGTRTTWFTDRPERTAGTTTLNRLARTWTAMGFRNTPPNAALLLTHKGQTRTHVITLTQPRIGKGRVSFRIRAVPNTTEAGHTHINPLRRGRYARAQLFIDNTAIPPCGAVATVGVTCLLPQNGTLSGDCPPSCYTKYPYVIGNGVTSISGYRVPFAICTYADTRSADLAGPGMYLWSPYAAGPMMSDSCDGNDFPDSAVETGFFSFPWQLQNMSFGEVTLMVRFG